jgi:hypothetical protein
MTARKRPSSVMLRVHPDFAKAVRRAARRLSRGERTTVTAPEVTRRLTAYVSALFPAPVSAWRAENFGTLDPDDAPGEGVYSPDPSRESPP